MKAIRDGANLTEASIATPAGLKTLRLGGDMTTTSLDGPLARVSTWAGLRTEPFYETPSPNLAFWGDSMVAGAGTVAPPNDTWWEFERQPQARRVPGGRGRHDVGPSACGAHARHDAPQLGEPDLYGHNGANAAQTISDIRAMLAQLSPDPLRRRFLIGLPTQNSASGAGGVGTAGYQAILDTRSGIIANWRTILWTCPAR